MASNVSLLGSGLVDFAPTVAHAPLPDLYGMVQAQALVVSMKEIYGWLLIAAIISLVVIFVSYGPVRPFAIFPKWSTIRRAIRHVVRTSVHGDSHPRP